MNAPRVPAAKARLERKLDEIGAAVRSGRATDAPEADAVAARRAASPVSERIRHRLALAATGTREDAA